ncbi:hypothetical protein C7E18_21530, partial [Stenotrophomonas maltophilia]
MVGGGGERVARHGEAWNEDGQGVDEALRARAHLDRGGVHDRGASGQRCRCARLPRCVSGL